MIKNLTIFVFTLFVSLNLFGQSDTTESAVSSAFFRLPMDLIPSLSGNYGELRATHFHEGLDMRTKGVAGANVYAAADGYVSKISVSPYGYGNVIYLQHPNGTTTVYGHLQDFSPIIAKWVKEQQYKQESFVVILEPDPVLFPVKKGDLIAKSGNSGSSAGPHLHFEIRETDSQTPVDPIKAAGFSIEDTLPPIIRRVSFFSLSNLKTVPVRELIKSFTDTASLVTAVSDTFFVAADAIDKIDKSGAKLAVARYNFYLDSVRFFSFSPDSIPYDKGRYVNTLVDYQEKQQYGRYLVKSWVEPGNGLISNIKVVGNGLVILPDNKEHSVMVEVLDDSGNKTQRTYFVKKDSIATTPVSDVQLSEKGIFMHWSKQNVYENGSVKLILPTGTLYSSIIFSADSYLFKGRTIWRIGNVNTPIHKFCRLSIKSDIDPVLKEKALIARLYENSKYVSIGGVWNGDYIEESIGSFGNFFVTVDTLAPVIRPSFKQGFNATGRKTLKITIADNLSGIGSYKVYVDDKWILAIFDGKTGILSVNLDPEKIDKGKKHAMSISVCDNKGNENIVKTSFIW